MALLEQIIGANNRQSGVFLQPPIRNRLGINRRRIRTCRCDRCIPSTHGQSTLIMIKFGLVLNNDNGTFKFMTIHPLLSIHFIHTCNFWATLCVFPTSFVHTQAAKPYLTSLALLIAWKKRVQNRINDTVPQSLNTFANFDIVWFFQ